MCISLYGCLVQHQSVLRLGLHDFSDSELNCMEMVRSHNLERTTTILLANTTIFCKINIDIGAGSIYPYVFGTEFLFLHQL